MGKRPVRVLHIVPSLSRVSGVASFVYNMNMYHDETRVHYDFMHQAMINGVHMRENRYDEELIASGSKVYTVNSASNDMRRFMREVHEVFSAQGAEYDIVHCHMPNSAFVTLKEAKAVGITNRILHSHLDTSSDKFLHRVRNAPLILAGKRYVTDRIACSEDAGRYLFGTKPFITINNGIPLDKFAYNEQVRSKMREELGIKETDTVIGCVGRFVKQKNIPFGIKVFSQFHKNNPDSKLVIVGDGEQRADVEKQIAMEQLGNDVLLLGTRKDTAKLYSIMDTLIMPSLYEGLPVTAIEAQASGLPCVYSENVSRDTDVTHTGYFLSLDASYSEWAASLEKATRHERLRGNPAILESRGYSAKTSAGILMDHYEQIVRNKK